MKIMTNNESSKEEWRTDAEFRADWYALSAIGLARAYGSDEPEYDETMLREINPAYEPQ